MAAISLSKVEETAPALVSLYKTAGASLAGHGLEGQRAAVYLVLDHSGSMRPYYRDGSVQALADRVLAVGAPGRRRAGTGGLLLHRHRRGRRDRARRPPRQRRADRGLARPHGADRLPPGDGRRRRPLPRQRRHRPGPRRLPDRRRPHQQAAAERYLCKAARLPLFWQFIGFGDPHSRQFDFLRRLDELPVPGRRVVDNAGFFHAGREPRAMPDAELYDRLVGEFPKWLAAARAQGS